MLSFLGIGAQKAGTTWLYEQLKAHPGLAFPRGKELHFWNNPHDAAGVAAYLASFETVGTKAGEITPAYALLPVETIRVIRQHLPHLRLVYLIRNPIERAWSGALMALGRAEMTLEEASDHWFIDHFRSAGSLSRGDYGACLRNWGSVFPMEQLLVLRFEQIQSEPESLLQRCFSHVGAPALDVETLRRNGCRNAVFQGPGHPLRPSLLPVLRGLYEARIQALARALDQDLTAWLDV
ncbi:sulfotransferase [Thiocapsa rosea]|uniref:Sulfotransferase domain-containing protein n=1 Tax=Thiocapsa rosea TaxID=69360 RepID=A0A495V4W8_9GAMM|nr:sulfotransferase [Thiocapsa rosea]RKT44446.1 sulfotransferase domain-containing protein [Thiocapsa rosea]